MRLTGSQLLHEAGKRIIQKYLESSGATGVELSPAMRSDATGVDIRWSQGGAKLTGKVKIDCYCGTDAGMIANRDLPFYRRDTASYALESVADTATRAPGWVFSSVADELLYYRLAIGRPERDVAELLDFPDGVFFSELAVGRDELRRVPMSGLRQWFESAAERYTPRPVMAGSRTAWLRLVPMAELDGAVPGVRVVGPIYSRLGVK